MLGKKNFNVCILGPDGVGKSTLIKSINFQLKNIIEDSETVHLKPKLFKRKNDNKKPEEPCINPHGSENRSALLSIVKILFWVLETWIDAIGNSNRVKLRIWDRYYYDVYIDPKRYRYGAPIIIAKLLGKLIPKPDIIIVLIAPCKVIQNRVQEVAKEETARQVNEYKKFAEKYDALLIDTSKEFESYNKVVGQVIINELKKRSHCGV